MKNRRQSRWLLAAVLSALPAVALPMSAHGQAQINANGHLHDANPQIGSGGMNGSVNPLTAGAPGGPGVVGNQLVTGNQIMNSNVTGFAGFQGKEPIPALGQWQGGALAGQPQANFIRESTGVPQAYGPGPGINQTTPYYSQSQFPVAPAGYIANNTQNGFIPAPPPLPQGAFDQRIGSQPGIPIIALPRPGDLLLPGAVDPTTGAPSILVASPLMGIKQFNPGDVADQSFLNQLTNVQQTAANGQQLDMRTIERLREELSGTSGEAAAGTLVNGINPNGGMISGGPIAQSITQSMPPANTTAANRLLGNRELPTTNPLPNGELANNVVRGSTAQQSGQYSQMQKMLEFYNNFANAQQAGIDVHNQEVAKANAKAGVGPTGLPLTAPPVGVKPAPAAGAAKLPPLVVHSLTKDVQAKGMHDVLAKAEALMKAGKFSSAIDEYNMADQIAKGQPIDSLVWIGRANAELGAGFYARAESQLKAALTKDPALMMAKYDLRTFIGEDRLKLIITDLKEIASKDKQSPTPVFLLAYISYNMDQEPQATGFLDMAEKRANGKDPFYKLLRDHWTLPTADQAAPAK